MLAHSVTNVALIASLCLPLVASAVTLEEAFSGFQSCRFPGFYYAPWESKAPRHRYFIDRGLKPYKELDGLYYFKVDEKFHGLPVSELIVPGIWDFHAIVFSVPLSKSGAVLKRKFGKSFAFSKASEEGQVPALTRSNDNTNQSILFCNEVEGGL